MSLRKLCMAIQSVSVDRLLGCNVRCFGERRRIDQPGRGRRECGVKPAPRFGLKIMRWVETRQPRFDCSNGASV